MIMNESILSAYEFEKTTGDWRGTKMGYGRKSTIKMSCKLYHLDTCLKLFLGG